MKKLTFLIIAVLVLGSTLNAQVVVSSSTTATPDASSALDIQSTDGGILIPRMTQTQRNAISSPATGLLIFQSDNTPGFYYYNGAAWIRIGRSGDDWSVTGNSGTSISTNFIGTTDNVDFATRTNNTERLRVESDGQIVIGNTYTAPIGTDKFVVRGNTTNWSAINGYSNVSGGYGVYGEDGGDGIGVYGIASTSGVGVFGTCSGGTSTATGIGVYGSVDDDDAIGVWASNDDADGTALIGLGNGLSTASYIGDGTGGAFTGYHGVYGKGTNSSGTGVIGVGNNNSTYSTLPNGGGGAFSGRDGVYGKGTNSSGTGVIGVGNNNGTFSTLTTGSGGAFRGSDGVYGKSYGNNSSNGTGVIGVGNNKSPHVYTNGSGIAGTGFRVGVYGYATRTGTGANRDRVGGYFEDNNTYACVGGQWGGTAYGILSNGTKSTVVKDLNNDPVIMYCPEAPEVLFQDYGDGKLVNGKAHITIDPVLSKNIHVDESHPIRVFIQLEGDCNGVYVTHKSANGFDVIELQGGASNVSFSWQITATRANEEFIQKDGSVEVSDYSKRFPPGPEKLDPIIKEVKTTAVIEQENSVQENVKALKSKKDIDLK